MKSITTIKGQPVIEVYESFDGSYWFVTDKWPYIDSFGRGHFTRERYADGSLLIAKSWSWLPPWVMEKEGEDGHENWDSRVLFPGFCVNTA